mmetsp:Transcript_12004/g.15197  ORF Transcript_12004/g.15197 Transcript_12004/m.15197 type:complete len:281 (-) Transcript_12004:276-1118(-)
MKIITAPHLHLLLLLSSLQSCYGGGPAKYPSVSIKIQDGNFGSFEGIDPILSYSTGTSAMGCDFEAGATASIKPTVDVLSLPRSLWAKISSTVNVGGGGGSVWRLSSKVGLSHKDNYQTPKIDLQATSSSLDASVKVGDLKKIEVNKGFGLGSSGKLYITPRYNRKSNTGDVTLEYGSESGGTTVTIDASKSLQTLTVSQQIAEGHVITPRVTSKGDMSLSWKMDLSSRSGDSVTTTIYPGEKIDVKWEDGPWVAQFNTALDGFKTEGLTVRVHRKVSFI